MTKKEETVETPSIDTLTLLSGSHVDRDRGVCAMEAVAWLAGEPHSDHPECVSPVIGAFVRNWNDGIRDDETRTRILRPFLPDLIGTRSTPEVEEQRAWLATDWLVRVCAPVFLELTPSLRRHANDLSGSPPVLSRETAELVQYRVYAARDAAWSTVRDAAWAAAWDAVRDAAGAAARAAAWDAAWGAARSAVGGAYWAAARASESAAGDTAEAALQPTVERLQVSATDLLRRMIEAGQ